MCIHYLRRLTSTNRSSHSNSHLGFVLSFIAGATNAGAFLAVGIYTSHMTGVVSSLADNLVLGQITLSLAAIGAVLSFLGGAITSTVMIHYAKRRTLSSLFALPLMLEALLLLIFGLLGSHLAKIQGFLYIPATVMLLCFMMGLQNAVITKISGALVRTTHLTGTITDLGIELGKLIYWNRRPQAANQKVQADFGRIKLFTQLLSAFFIGGLCGALGFKYAGYITTVPLAAVLVVIAIVPIIDDLKKKSAE